MTVELLYLDGCPSYAALEPRLQRLLCDAGVNATIERRAIESTEGAFRQGFLGSPTVRIDGVDVEPGAGERRDFGLKCRLYRTPRGLSPVPLDEWILAALEPSAPAERAPGPSPPMVT